MDRIKAISFSSFALVIFLSVHNARAEESEKPVPAVVCETKMGKTVAITFDDGPSSITTPKILEILKENGVKATFFVVGNNIERNKPLMGKIIEAGHEIGNHSYTHPQLARVSVGQIKSELDRTNKAIFDATGIQPVWFRPPYGSVNNKVRDVASELGLKTIMWTEDPRDWSKRSSASSIEKHVLSNLRPGSVVLLHDNHQNTIDAIPYIFKSMKEQGYRFVTVDELKKEEHNIELAKSGICSKSAPIQVASN